MFEKLDLLFIFTTFNTVCSYIMSIVDFKQEWAMFH